MSNSKNKDFGSFVLFNVFMLTFFAVMLIIGTFNDEAIAKTLFSPDNIPIKFVTSLGVYPFFAMSVLFSGALYERVMHSKINKAVKVTVCILIGLLATFVGFIGAGSLVDKDSLGSIFPELNRNIPVIIGISVVSIFPLAYLGFSMAKKTDDGTLAKHIICLLILLALSYAALQVLKNVFHRPRYRLAVLGYEGIGFVKWYTPFSGSQDLVEAFGIDAGEFRSFPSGHSILSMALVYILQSFAWFSPGLRNKRLILGVLGFIFAVIIMFTRMILGAHYLSDVSAGAIIGALLALVYTVIQHRISVSVSM